MAQGRILSARNVFRQAIRHFSFLSREPVLESGYPRGARSQSCGRSLGPVGKLVGSSSRLNPSRAVAGRSAEPEIVSASTLRSPELPGDLVRRANSLDD